MPKTEQYKYDSCDGTTINPIYFWTEMYSLCTFFGASKNIYKNYFDAKQRYNEYSIFNIFKDIEFTEAQKRLISIAIICRNELENNGKRGLELEENNIGTILIKNKKDNLNLKETCNKIIHAKNIEFEASSTNKWSGYLKSKIYLYGTYKGEKWKATINVYKFINSCFILF